MTDEVQNTEELAQAIDAAPVEETGVESTQPKKKGRGSKTQQEEPSETAAEGPSLGQVGGDLELGIFALTEGAVIPEFKTEESACFDLTAVIKTGDQLKIVTHAQNVSTRKATDKGVMVQQGERLLIPTGLAFDIPQGYCLEIYPRSGISFSRGISLNNCTAIIDSDYVEEVFISVNNISGGSQYIENGERIAQAKLVKLVETKIRVLDKKPGQKTSRKGGFGSTGTK